MARITSERFGAAPVGTVWVTVEGTHVARADVRIARSEGKRLPGVCAERHVVTEVKEPAHLDRIRDLLAQVVLLQDRYIVE